MRCARPQKPHCPQQVTSSQGNNDLSVRTQRQALAAEMASQPMQDLYKGVAGHAELAIQARQQATQASGLAIPEEETVRRLIDTIEAIMRSSQKMADIVAVIDGIAFQTIILALNAAVETARAGEHGRGIAVVATEVRTLAQRSSSAAREIRAPIAQNRNTVESGMAQAIQVRGNMGQMSRSSGEVAATVKHMASTTDQRAQHIQQAKQAIHARSDGVSGEVENVSSIAQLKVFQLHRLYGRDARIRGVSQLSECSDRNFNGRRGACVIGKPTGQGYGRGLTHPS